MPDSGEGGLRADSGRRTLNGWKEISDHLSCSVATAQRWERDMGLPVRRPDGPSGQVRTVFAVVDEVEEWFARQRDVAASEGAAPRRVPGGRARSRWLVAAAGSVAAALIVTAAFTLWPPPGPVGAVSIRNGRTVEAFGLDGQPLWAFEVAGSGTERDVDERGRPTAVLTDLDGDGDREVVVALLAHAHLLALDSSGNVRWEWPESTEDPAASSPVLRILGIEAVEDQVIVVSSEPGRDTADIFGIGPRGQTRWSYRHEGVVEAFRLLDYGADGRIDLLIGGSLAPTGEGTVEVLDLAGAARPVAAVRIRGSDLAGALAPSLIVSRIDPRDETIFVNARLSGALRTSERWLRLDLRDLSVLEAGYTDNFRAALRSLGTDPAVITSALADPLAGVSHHTRD